jgi:hypothetical protein
VFIKASDISVLQKQNGSRWGRHIVKEKANHLSDIQFLVQSLKNVYKSVGYVFCPGMGQGGKAKNPAARPGFWPSERT